MLAGMVAPIGGTDSVVYATISSNVNNITMRSYFTSADWSSSVRKELIINSGVTIGSTTSSTPAVTSNTSWGGTIALTVNGTVGGAGGTSGSIGGHALQVQQTNFILRGTGSILSGGGGGGLGGLGGQGVYYTGRTVTQGEYYDGVNYYYNAARYAWAGGSAPGGWTPAGGSFEGTVHYDGVGTFNQYAIYIYQTVYDVPNYTTGGNGGSGGRGQGTDGTSAAGSTGSAGGTNAGTGGTGGAGGAYGSSGGAGNSGSAGNNGSGASGSGGAAPGSSILGYSNVTNLSTCTLTGPTS